MAETTVQKAVRVSDVYAGKSMLIEMSDTAAKHRVVMCRGRLYGLNEDLGSYEAIPWLHTKSPIESRSYFTVPSGSQLRFDRSFVLKSCLCVQVGDFG